jgi:hypothetical protein
MGQCRLCGRKGFFLRVTEGGVCTSCGPDFRRDCSDRIRIIKECARLIAESKNPKIRLSRCDLLIEHTQALLGYQYKGIPTTSVPPSEILEEYTATRKQIIEGIESEAKCPYCNVRLEKLPRTKKRCNGCGNTIRVKEGSLYTDAEFEKEEEKERRKLFKELNIYRVEDLMDYMKSGVVQHVEILAVMDERTCENCKKWNGKKIPLDQAIKESVLPIRNCTGSWCRCSYAPVVDV